MSRAQLAAAKVGRPAPALKLVVPPVGRTPAPCRHTVWFEDLPGFGLRTYAGGRQAYLVQTRMRGRLRLVTLGSAALISETEARRLARQVLLRAQTGSDPAEDRKAVRNPPVRTAVSGLTGIARNSEDPAVCGSRRSMPAGPDARGR